MNDNMEFRKAKREEAEEILQLYQSLIGTEYWRGCRKGRQWDRCRLREDD